MLKKISWYMAKVLSKLKRSQEPMLNFYRKRGINVGKGCLICSKLPTSNEAKLIRIGENSVISTDVCFVTHDFSVSKVIPGKSNLFGKIEIGNNCFIGERAMLLYGIKLADNVIVAAGSVVTKSFLENNIIIGGNPAKIISTWKAFAEKSCLHAVNEDFNDSFLTEKVNYLVKR